VHPPGRRVGWASGWDQLPRVAILSAGSSGPGATREAHSLQKKKPSYWLAEIKMVSHWTMLDRKALELKIPIEFNRYYLIR
jgi:hypothetical protein